MPRQGAGAALRLSIATESLLVVLPELMRWLVSFAVICRRAIHVLTVNQQRWIRMRIFSAAQTRITLIVQLAVGDV